MPRISDVMPYAPRLANIGLAAWLLLSMFLWPHAADPILFTGLITVALIVAFEAMSLMEPSVRFATMVMGFATITQAFVVKQYLPWYRWHDVVLGALVVVISLVPNKAVPATPSILDEKPGH